MKKTIALVLLHLVWSFFHNLYISALLKQWSRLNTGWPQIKLRLTVCVEFTGQSCLKPQSVYDQATSKSDRNLFLMSDPLTFTVFVSFITQKSRKWALHLLYTCFMFPANISEDSDIAAASEWWRLCDQGLLTPLLDLEATPLIKRMNLL